MEAVVRDIVAEEQQHVREGMEALETIAKHRHRPSEVRGPSLERETTGRERELLRAWDRLLAKYSPRRVGSDALRRGERLSDAIYKWRKEVMACEAKIARLERHRQETFLKQQQRVKQYAINWLLGGHPNSYTPSTWSALAGNSSRVALASIPPEHSPESAHQEINALRASVKHLRSVLVDVALGYFTPDYLVEVERDLQRTRPESRSLITYFSGHQLPADEIQVPSVSAEGTADGIH